MENKDNKKKTSNFFKKEGFYVVLFICLCIVATAAVVTTRKNKKRIEKENQTGITQQSKVTSDAKTDKGTVNNALQVKTNNSNDSKNTVTKTDSKNTTEKKIITIPKKTNLTTKKVKEQEFKKPVEGKLVREYSKTPVYWKTTESSRPNYGIDIKVDKDVKVVAVLDGVVQKVQETKDGLTVVIYHPNKNIKNDKNIKGIRTVYSNLAKDVKVKEGDKVKQGFEIGKIGATTIRAAYEEYGKEFLHFEMILGEKEEAQYQSVDPNEYLKYQKIQK